MRIAEARGMVIKGKLPIPRETVVTVRTESTDGFSTLSLADDIGGLMLQVVVTPEVKRLLKEVCK